MFYCDTLANGDTVLRSWTGAVFVIRPFDTKVTLGSPLLVGAPRVIQGRHQRGVDVSKEKALALPPDLPPGAKLIVVTSATDLFTKT